MGAALYIVVNSTEPGFDTFVSGKALSRAEEKLIREIYDRYGQMNRWAIVDYVHTFPEWRNPHGGALPISIRDILKAGGEDDQEIRAVVRELHAMATAEEQLSPV